MLILKVITAVLAVILVIFNSIDGKIILSVVWGIVALLNVISIILILKNNKK